MSARLSCNYFSNYYPGPMPERLDSSRSSLSCFSRSRLDSLLSFQQRAQPPLKGSIARKLVAKCGETLRQQTMASHPRVRLCVIFCRRPDNGFQLRQVVRAKEKWRRRLVHAAARRAVHQALVSDAVLDLIAVKDLVCGRAQHRSHRAAKRGYARHGVAAIAAAVHIHAGLVNLRQRRRHQEDHRRHFFIAALCRPLLLRVMSTTLPTFRCLLGRTFDHVQDVNHGGQHRPGIQAHVVSGMQLRQRHATGDLRLISVRRDGESFAPETNAGLSLVHNELGLLLSIHRGVWHHGQAQEGGQQLQVSSLRRIMISSEQADHKHLASIRRNSVPGRIRRKRLRTLLLVIGEHCPIRWPLIVHQSLDGCECYSRECYFGKKYSFLFEKEQQIPFAMSGTANLL
jgi:hypothetical protein